MITAAGVLDRAIIWTPESTITAIADAVTPANRQSFGYDLSDRLTSANGNYGAISYSYDKNGNRLSKADDKTNAFDSNKRLSKGSLQYTYASNSRLIAVTDRTGKIADYLHNGKGERVSKTVNGVVTQYLYDFSGNLVAEIDGTIGAVEKEYVYGLTGRLATIEADGSVYWHHNDHLGTPQVLTNNTKAIVWSMEQTPFGIATVNEDVDGDGVLVQNNFRFPGQYFDSESGLNYNYFRTYDTASGRYTQHDPIGLSGGINSYSYVNDDPIKFKDFFGLTGWYCQRPLGDYSGENGSGLPVFNHQFICVTLTDGTTKCDSTNNPDDDNNPATPAEGLSSKPERDNRETGVCEEIDDDSNRCFESCVLKKWNKPRPSYAIGPLGTDCQEYSREIRYRCSEKCRRPNYAK